ncbi:acyl carrier protein [Clostridium cavendishii DSM 21758]|uniref:Acyl carrier protein n=1 Tax=Clostridium cavendishii DSM 21758 TaxID=1121302 RepID=A0A1M6KHU5_9CLOT|nr:acyl carrier protein [Clostridium cavendishii]SHJ58497.1 acyl carrier protein [Clostridium cavendishii DSM 21758]
MVFEKIKGIIVEQLGIEEDKVNLQTTFEELGADSLDLFQVIIEIEEEFGIQLEDAEKIKKVEDAVKYVESKIEA